MFCGVDEMREMASTIKTEMLAELNVTRQRLHQVASDSIGYNTPTNQDSSYMSSFWAKVKSHTSCRKQQQAENDVSMACAKCLNAMKVNRTLKQLVEGTCPLFEAMCLATDVVNEGGHRPKERSRGRGGVLAFQHNNTPA